jgi:hypothetical protein
MQGHSMQTMFLAKHSIYFAFPPSHITNDSGVSSVVLSGAIYQLLGEPLPTSSVRIA